MYRCEWRLRREVSRNDDRENVTLTYLALMWR